MNRLRLVLMAAVLLSAVGCDKEPPSRDYIPVLKDRIFALQEAIKSESRAAIDSLLSTDILDVGQGSDSLLKFCWGANHGFAFDRLGDCGIIYTDDYAVSDCFVMDSSGVLDHPIRLVWVQQHDLWLLQRFDRSEPVDSL